MTDEPDTTEPTDTIEHLEAQTEPTLVVGSNQGEARRAAAALDLPKRNAIAIDQLTDDHLDQTIGTARVDGDNASGWTKLEGVATINLLE